MTPLEPNRSLSASGRACGGVSMVCSPSRRGGMLSALAMAPRKSKATVPSWQGPWASGKIMPWVRSAGKPKAAAAMGPGGAARAGRAAALRTAILAQQTANTLMAIAGHRGSRSSFHRQPGTPQAQARAAAPRPQTLQRHHAHPEHRLVAHVDVILAHEVECAVGADAEHRQARGHGPHLRLL